MQASIIILGYPGAKIPEPHLYSSCFIDNEFLHLQTSKFRCGSAGKDSCRARQNQLRAIKFRFDMYGWPADSFDIHVSGLPSPGSTVALGQSLGLCGICGVMWCDVMSEASGLWQKSETV